MTLKISTEPMESRQLALKVEVDQERVTQELRKAARKVAGQYRIPGFRPGKAPYSVIVQYVGLPTLFNEFIEPLGEEIYKQALEESSIEPYAMAALDVDGLDPLTYRFVVPLEPEIDLGDYRSLRIQEESPEVTDEEIEAELNSYREDYAAWKDVERPSQYGDTLTIDVRSVLIPSEGEAEAGQEGAPAAAEETVVLDETNWDVTLDQENPMDPPGFDEALLGLRPGEEKDFVLSWPADSRSINAGKQARFHIKVHTIRAFEQPALDNAFAQLVGPDFQTLDDLKANVRESLLASKKELGESDYLDKALDELVAQSKMNYPPVVIEDQLDVMLDDFERQLRQYGIESLDVYLKQAGQSREEYRESLRSQAETIARRNLVISELYRQEGVEISDQEIEERIQAMVGSADADQAESARALADLMRQGAGRSILESQLLRDSALNRLLAIVRGEELPPIPVKEQTQPDSVEAAGAEAASTETVDGETANTETSTAEAEPATGETAAEPSGEGDAIASEQAA
jgi:trigger factor